MKNLIKIKLVLLSVCIGGASDVQGSQHQYASAAAAAASAQPTMQSMLAQTGSSSSSSSSAAASSSSSAAAATLSADQMTSVLINKALIDHIIQLKNENNKLEAENNKLKKEMALQEERHQKWMSQKNWEHEGLTKEIFQPTSNVDKEVAEFVKWNEKAFLAFKRSKRIQVWQASWRSIIQKHAADRKPDEKPMNFLINCNRCKISIDNIYPSDSIYAIYQYILDRAGVRNTVQCAYQTGNLPIDDTIKIKDCKYLIDGTTLFVSSSTPLESLVP